MQAINLDTFSLSLLTAKEDILNGRASTDWALFAYDGFTNNLKLFDSGNGGLTELAQKFHIAKPMYGLCRIALPGVEQSRIILICWVGEDVEEFRRTECASHVPAVRSFFKEAHVFISASNKDELTEEKIAEILAKVRPPMERFRRSSKSTEKEETVGTNYRKTNAAMEMRWINRESFWARAEREEEERKEEEKKRAVEDRRRRERERVLQEKKEAEERDRKMNEKLQMIEEQRKLDAKRQEEARRQEKTRWEVQQREHEEEMRARLRRSESIEKAAEAAALVSQRSMNPREFFRQLSQSSTSPVSPRSGKPPFRRYQRSLTDTAFIFEKASASSGPTSPISPSVTSPFSRTPTSPFNRCMSPTSPSFRPIKSPQSPHAPLRTPPTSPVECSAPPISFLPSLPESKAPPPQSSLPDLPPAQITTVTESSSVIKSKSSSVEDNEQKPATIPDATSAPLPDKPVPVKESISELLIDTCMPDGIEEDLDIIVGPKKEEAKLPSEACTACLPLTETSISSQDLAEAEQAFLPRSEHIAVSALIEVDEPIEEEEPEQEEAEKSSEFGSSGEQPESETLASNEETLVKETGVNIGYETEVCVEETKNLVIEEGRPDQNGVCPQNGTAKECDDSSDHSTPEKYTYIVNREDSEEEDAQSEEAENGESSADRPLLRVRALYDYQAEDETEISFEPGDIIMDVETVDKAWWRGFSKDGRHGLFPSNYVETI
ncbi:drebrin-like protein B isoform X1 [Tachysurus vachellii]|uniref:drebrin-like protein B isoform X1 n=1 Tax=Tachysurus vachellii TaxID=175792 RepID=UPI00296B1175|nr:drebrin-like protein B isoform X1 [Tachysurus vachellii]